MRANNILLVFSIVVASSFSAIAQTADDILGKWQSGHGNGRIEIYKRGDTYFGKIIWLKDPTDESGKPKVDIHNPSKELRSQPIIGLDVLKDLTYKGNGVWGNGEIYDPKSGRSYNSQLSLPEKNKLNIRAYFGISLLGKTETWTRVQ